jgi:hypothetical protein
MEVSMDFTAMPDEFNRIREQLVNRRNFMQRTGMAGLAAVAAPLLAGAFTPLSARAEEKESPAEAAEEAAQAKDTVAEIATAALIAEDLATTFYYNGLVGAVIQDPALAGPGGSATNVTTGDAGNVGYIRAALGEEISHANLLRSLLGIPKASEDPVQTFYFPAGTFDTLGPFLGLLDALENAFIGAYLNAVQEFATMAAKAQAKKACREWYDPRYSPEELIYLAKVSASIMGIECEHRVLGRDLSESIPANNRNYETNDGITAVYNGKNSAVVALTPFLTSSTGPGYSLQTALAHKGSVILPVAGTPPAF